MRSDNPRKTIVKMLLLAHGWKRGGWRSAAWYPPGSTSTFGEAITDEALKTRGYPAIASQLLGIENTLMNWVEADIKRKREWVESIIMRKKEE